MKSFDSADLEIVFCDNHLLIVNKPPGLLTQPTETESESLELYAKEWVKKEYAKSGAVFLHCIHRLDRPVSGLVLFARTSKALSRLNEQSRDQEIQRIYTGEVQGVLSQKEGKLDHYLVHAEHCAKVVRANDPGAKHCRLTYEVIRFKERTTLVKIDLETGRYHQIRAQFGAIGHPIVKDKRYGGSGDGKEIHLHCSYLALKHPVTKEVLTFESPAPFN